LKRGKIWKVPNKRDYGGGDWNKGDGGKGMGAGCLKRGEEKESQEQQDGGKGRIKVAKGGGKRKVKGDRKPAI